MRDQVGRRAVLRLCGGLAAFAGGLENLRAAEQRGGAPLNIIWMVADGMSPGVLPLAEHFSILARGKSTIWTSLYKTPGTSRGLMDMASLESIVTDSSSASSTWATGSRILNSWVNMLPDGTPLVPIGVLAHNRGQRVGLVTTTTVTHATPAGFAAISRERDDEAGIATQYIDVCDVVLGGGSSFFEAATRRDKRDLLAKGPRLLGLFSRSHLPYTLDLRNDPTVGPDVPTLAEMAETALRLLEGSRRGFLLQIEGGRVDHAAHDNDAASMLWEQLGFDDAIGVVLRFAEKNPDTLVVITTDHGNANPGLNGTGSEYAQSNECFRRLLDAKSSVSRVTPKITVRPAADAPRGAPRPKPSAQVVNEVIKATYGVALAADETEWLRSTMGGARRVTIGRQYDRAAGVLGQILSNYHGIGWTGTSHTSDYSVVAALGPGSSRFQGFIRNTDVFDTLREFMEIEYRNPSMTPERAKQLQVARVGRPQLPHWV
ncbi:MAG: alkaline phosphatase [candidate division NC10 bacterium]|nr:alkaline phosphatase [candidate division NC10 bacterium]